MISLLLLFVVVMFYFSLFLFFLVVICLFLFLLSIVFILVFLLFLLFVVVIRFLYLILIVSFSYGALKAVVVPELECSIKTMCYVFLIVWYYFLLFRMVTDLGRVVTENGGGNNVFAVTPTWRGVTVWHLAQQNWRVNQKTKCLTKKSPRTMLFAGIFLSIARLFGCWRAGSGFWAWNPQALAAFP